MSIEGDGKLSLVLALSLVWYLVLQNSNAFNTHTRTLPSPEPSISSSLLGALPLSGTDHMTDSTPLVIVPFPNLHTFTKMGAISINSTLATCLALLTNIRRTRITKNKSDWPSYRGCCPLAVPCTFTPPTCLPYHHWGNHCHGSSHSMTSTSEIATTTLNTPSPLLVAILMGQEMVWCLKSITVALQLASELANVNKQLIRTCHQTCLPNLGYDLLQQRSLETPCLSHCSQELAKHWASGSGYKESNRLPSPCACCTIGVEGQLPSYLGVK